MTTSNSGGKGAGRRGAKSVIEHDPLSMEEDALEETAVEAEEAKPAPKAKKKATAKASAAEAAGEVVSLGESLTIAEVADVHQRLLVLLQGGGTVALSAGDTENIDGAGLQLLAAFARDAGKQGVTISWQGVSDPLRKAAGQVGLQGVLGLDKAG